MWLRPLSARVRLPPVASLSVCGLARQPAARAPRLVRAHAPPPLARPPTSRCSSSTGAPGGGSGGGGDGGGGLFRDQNDTWVDRHAPAALQPYLKLARVDRPIGTYLVLAPGLWGLALAAPAGGLPDPTLAALFTAGAFLMRGAGCTINDIWDRDVDGQVARTAQRPLASGRLGLLPACVFLGAQLSAGLAVLLQLNAYTIGLGCAIVPVVLAYPLMKRRTHWPQAVLGVAMNYGVVMGWGATHGCVDAAVVLPMFAGAWAWTLVYDTLYAHQDKADDARLGLKSTALLMGDRSADVLSGFALLAGAAWALAGLNAGLAWPHFAAAAAATGHLLWQVRSADYGDRASLARRFVSNQWVCWLVLAGLLCGRLLQPPLAEGGGDSANGDQ